MSMFRRRGASGAPGAATGGGGGCSVSLPVLLMTNILVFQVARGPSFSGLDPKTAADAATTILATTLFGADGSNSSSSLSWISSVNENLLHNPLDIPPGSPPNLPSIRVEDPNLDKQRDIYGGQGDKGHLGGFTELDTEGISPSVWTNLILKWGIHSFLDVGCGRGISTLWFLEHDVDVLCVEGSHDAVTKSYLPRDKIVEHDYSRGPWWPEKTYDVVWSVEFLEHVSRQYHFNYISTFRKAALLIVTSSRWGGWHHTEIHNDEWWIQKYELYGFRYQPTLTAQVRKWAEDETQNSALKNPNGKPFYGRHLIASAKVFSNPAVAALPRHAHLFPEHGCFKDYNKQDLTNPYKRPCGQGEETPLSPEMEPLPVLPEQHQRWYDKIKAGLKT